MVSQTSLLTFAAASLALALVPGPAVLFILARSVELGRRGALLTAAGLALGNVGWAIAAGVGLAGLIATSAGAFAVVKLGGALYLATLGVRRIASRTPPAVVGAAEASVDLGRTFRQAVLVNLLNPKIAVFFVAFLPPFLDPSRGSVGLQALTLGMTFAVVGWATDSGYAVVAGSIGQRRLERAQASTAGRWLVGLTYLALGVVAATASGGHG